MLVADVDGGPPVLAATHPAMVAPFFLANRVFDYSLSGLLSSMLPASTQSCYEALETFIIDPILAPVLTVSGIGQANSWDWVATVSQRLLFLTADILFAVSVLAFMALSLVNVAAVTVVILSVALTRSLC